MTAYLAFSADDIDDVDVDDVSGVLFTSLSDFLVLLTEGSAFVSDSADFMTCVGTISLVQVAIVFFLTYT